MTHAYDKSLIERASDSVGRMLDFSVHSLRYDASDITELFLASGVAFGISRGDIRLICGMSGIELTYEILDRSGVSYDRVTPRHTRSLSSEYWYGYALAQIQWTSCLSFDHIIRTVSVQSFVSAYAKDRLAFLESLPPGLTEPERSRRILAYARSFAMSAVSEFMDSHKAGKQKTGTYSPLKIMRIKNGLSQSALARSSGVPLRTIQQYEQRQKDLSKARSEYLIMLSHALGCRPEALLDL